MEITHVTEGELLRDPAAVLDRVAAGERVEVTRDGMPIAVIGPPDLTEAMIEGLVKAGILEPDWRERQARTLQRLRDKGRHSAPGGVSGSETIVEMRNEERF